MSINLRGWIFVGNVLNSMFIMSTMFMYIVFAFSNDKMNMLFCYFCTFIEKAMLHAYKLLRSESFSMACSVCYTLLIHHIQETCYVQSLFKWNSRYFHSYSPTCPEGLWSCDMIVSDYSVDPAWIKFTNTSSLCSRHTSHVNL